LSRPSEARPFLARLLVALFLIVALAGLATLPFQPLPPKVLWMQQVFAVLAGAAVAVLLVEREEVPDAARLLGVLFLGSTGLLLAATVLGTASGGIAYTDNLGPRLGGLLPLGVPFLWTAVVGGSLAAARSLQGPPRPGWGEAVRLALSTATLATLISFTLDPVARVLRFWSWEMEGRLQGVPWLSLLGWWSTSLVLAMGALTFAPRLRLLRQEAPPGPIGLLLLLHLLLLGVAIRHGLFVGLVGGTGALVLLLLAFLRALAVRRGSPDAAAAATSGPEER
jgi:uncharacterized membrane protein